MPGRALLQLFCCSLLLSASCAAAAEGGSYLGAQAGMFLPIESSVYGEKVGSDGKVTYNPGLLLSVVGGHQFRCGIRTEAEIDYRHLTSDKFIKGGTTSKVDSSIDNFGVITNIYYDFSNRSAVTPFIGAGVGFAVTQFGKGNSSSSELWSDDSDLTISYQALGGFAVRLTDSTSLDFIYRHYAIPRLHFETLSAQFRGPNLSLGIRHWF